jgi:hypothetical protein
MMMMKRTPSLLLLLLLLILPLTARAQTESETLILRLSKDFGYAAGGTIQGTFTLKVRSPDDLVRVDFFIDGDVVSRDTESPFAYQFNTADLTPGEHRFATVGYRADGSQLRSDDLMRNVITGEQAWVEVRRILLPLMLGIGALTILGTVATALLGREKHFRLGEYGPAGGAVCPRCRLPYARNVLAPNLLVGKLQRCPHCGKLALVPAASEKELGEAEARYRQRGADEVDLPSQEDAYKKLLDESRFE